MKYLAILFTALVCHSQVVMNAYRSSGSVEDNNLLPQLVAFWKMDEASGYAVDSNTNAFHLTQFATVNTNTGKIDGSRDFVGTLNGFWTNNAVFHDLDTNDFTIAFWFKPDGSSSPGYIMSSGDFNGGHSWAIYITDQPDYVDYVGGRNLVFNINGIGQTEISCPIGAEGEPAPTDWCFGYVKRTGDDFEIGVAPPLESTITLLDTYTASASFDIASYGSDFSIGTALFNETPLEEWDGELDHVGIWQRALSECEILKLLRLRKHSQFDSDPCN